MKVPRSWLISPALLSVIMVLSPLASLAQTSAVRARVTQLVDMQNLVTLRGNVHPWARAEFDQGVAPDDLAMERMLLVLQRGADQETALRQLLDDQQVKSSPRFHQWLTPDQFGQQFGPADSDLQAVTDWLASQGFEVTKVSAGRTVIEFSGTAGLVRQVLGTEIHRFRVNGEDHWANTSDPQIPAALAPVVAGFASLNNFPKEPLYRRLGTFSRSKLTGEVQPLFTYPVSCSSGNCYWLALGPTDFATIYNVLPLWNAATPIDGTGVTIAVVGETNINPQDVADFRQMFGLPANQPNIILNGPDPGINGDEPEADLDVQWSGALAKGATIDFVVSESTETTAGVDLSALYIIDNNLAPVMSESYGECEAYLGTGGNQFYNTLWEQAAAQGITVLMAAGDSGSGGCDSANEGETYAQYGLGVSGFASTPFNVAVGGTDFNDANTIPTYWNQTNAPLTESSAKSYIPESTWNDSCASSGLLGCTPPPSSTYLSDGFYLLAGGGGASSCTNPTGTFPAVTCSGKYPKPSWQGGPGVPNDDARDIPDLSLFASNGWNGSFYVICEMDASVRNDGNSTSCDLNAPYGDFEGASGTSASVQVFAGIMAMVNQAHGRQGNANYVLYPMAAQSGASCNSSTTPVTNSSCIFYDITAGNNSVICKGGTPNCSSAGSGEYGIMVSGGLPAYPTTTGYDLATGLGSVNVANLVNKWKSNFTPSSITLALSTNPATNPITLTHGQPIDFTVKVTSGSGTPTGDVSLIAQTGSSASNVTGIGPFTLSGGSASGSTLMLPGGSYDVTAHYAGNGTYAASDSTPGIPVTVGKENSLTEVRLVTLSATAPPAYNVTTVPYGSPYFLRMDVTNSSGQLCVPTNSSGIQDSISYPCPTGNLTVSPAPTDSNPPAGTVAGSYTLNSQGYAEDQPIQQTPGVYNFKASYAGDNSYKPSTSPTVPVTVTKAPTTTTLSALPSTVVVLTQVTFTATISTQSYGAGLTGTLQFMKNGVPFSPPQSLGFLPAPGQYVTGEVTLYGSLPVGTSSITAQYSGDANYEGSTAVASTVTVTDFGLSANPSPVTISGPGQTGNSTISVTPQYGFTGTVNLSVASGCPTGATCTLSSPSVTVSGTSAVTDMLTVTTTGTGSVSPTQRRRVPQSFRFPAGLVWFLVGLLVLASLFSSSAKRRAAAVLFASALMVVGVWVACGGSGGGGGTTGPPPAPAVSLSPTSLAFASQTIGTTSPAQSVNLTNGGTANLTISMVTIGGANGSDFAKTADTCTGATVAPNNTCSLSVTFAPTAVGTRSASVSISDNATGSPQTVSLTGTGTSLPTPPGTYPIVVNGIAGNDSHSITVNVKVD